jgi:hypothetical protein
LRNKFLDLNNVKRALKVLATKASEAGEKEESVQHLVPLLPILFRIYYLTLSSTTPPRRYSIFKQDILKLAMFFDMFQMGGSGRFFRLCVDSNPSKSLGDKEFWQTGSHGHDLVATELFAHSSSFLGLLNKSPDRHVNYQHQIDRSRTVQ